MKDADRLATILKTKKLDFTLSEIRRMIGDEGPTQTLQLTQENGGPREEIAHAMRLPAQAVCGFDHRRGLANRYRPVVSN